MQGMQFEFHGNLTCSFKNFLVGAVETLALKISRHNKKLYFIEFLNFPTWNPLGHRQAISQFQWFAISPWYIIFSSEIIWKLFNLWALLQSTIHPESSIIKCSRGSYWRTIRELYLNAIHLESFFTEKIFHITFLSSYYDDSWIHHYSTMSL